MVNVVDGWKMKFGKVRSKKNEEVFERYIIYIGCILF